MIYLLNVHPNPPNIYQSAIHFHYPIYSNSISEKWESYNKGTTKYL